MVRHFLQLYLLIVITLAAVSWGQERIWQEWRSSDEWRAETRPQAASLAIVEEQLRKVSFAEREAFVDELAAATGVDLELFESRDIAGEETLASLARGEIALMREGSERAWVLKQLADDGRVLAFRYEAYEPRRTVLDWILAFIFYAAIALILMMWLWPLTRDLRALEQATMRFGDRNWRFEAHIKPGSQIYPLAQAFKRMAVRIDALIGSQKDLTNALSHEIKTPLARMRFEVEMARSTNDPKRLAQHLDSIDTDIADLNRFVNATLEYAILERAEVPLNIAAHDFTLILPAVAESVRRGARTELSIDCVVDERAREVRCDAHLIETVLRNLLYNALRYANTRVGVRFDVGAERYRLCVEDDGPGIPEAERRRVFDSFVQLNEPGRERSGFGLGLAIVKRIVEWHGGEVEAQQASLGGAAFVIEWPKELGREG
jgi:two-component system OmpR family sensor kinase